MGGLTSVIRAAQYLSGERNAPELPLPSSAIEAYARRYKLSTVFVELVRQYDNELMMKALGERSEIAKKSKANKTAA